MKIRFVSLGFALALAGALFAQEAVDRTAQLRVKVVDEAGLPVARARVIVSTYSAWVPGSRETSRDDYATQLGVTDANGLAQITLKGSSGRYGCMVLPVPEFHLDRGKEVAFTNAVAERWEPWGQEVTLVLKRKAREYEPVLDPDAANQVGPAGEPGISKDPLVAGPDRPSPVRP